MFGAVGPYNVFLRHLKKIYKIKKYYQTGNNSLIEIKLIIAINTGVFYVSWKFNLILTFN